MSRPSHFIHPASKRINKQKVATKNENHFVFLRLPTKQWKVPIDRPLQMKACPEKLI